LKDIANMRSGNLSTENLRAKYGFLHLDESLNGVLNSVEKKHHKAPSVSGSCC
jgi:hypothetical protein